MKTFSSTDGFDDAVPPKGRWDCACQDNVRVTIRDVARESGVSISTVSRVLNKTCPVSNDKSERVLEAVERLGYTPDPAARSLLLRQTGGLGVLLPVVSGEFFSEFLGGIDRCAQENGYHLLISSSHRNRQEFTLALQIMYGRVDGLLIMAPGQGRLDRKHRTLRDMPVVFVNTKISGDDVDVFNFANYDGAFKMTSHLIELGHERLAAIKGPPGAADAVERIRGFKAAIRKHRLSASGISVIEGDFTQEAGYEAVGQILSLKQRPTAIFAANDVCALGVLSALRLAGVSVPEEIAVAGFDDITSSRYSLPSLSTVRVPLYDIGTLAIQRLISRIESQTELPREQVELQVELMLRESTEGATHVRDIQRES